MLHAAAARRGGCPIWQVRRLDDEQAAFVAAWRTCSDWRRPGFPLAPRVWLLSGAALVVGAFWLSQTRCFERCSVADRFDGPPLYGNALNIVHAPRGWLVVGAWVAACAILAGHRLWLGARAREYVARGEGHGDEPPVVVSGTAVPLNATTSSDEAGPREEPVMSF